MNKTKYIAPIIGTVGDEKEHSFHGGGKTHPGACPPFGMVQLTPDYRKVYYGKSRDG